VLKPIRAEIKASIALLRELQLIRLAFDDLARPVRRKTRTVIGLDTQEIAKTLADAQALFRRVLNTMSRVQNDH